MPDNRTDDLRGLVLGGGGITGIAWMTGLVAGLAEVGIDLTDADVVVGTSAGSTVGGQLTTGIPLADLLARQLEPPAPDAPVASIGPRVLLGFGWAMLRARGDLESFGRRLGHWAVARADAGRTPTLEARYAAIRDRLPIETWPEHGRLRVAAVDADSGALRIFDGTDGVGLIDAVTASCAVPGVYPPVPIEGRRYIDGGARSTTNADLVQPCRRVVALVPSTTAVGPMASAQDQLSGVRSVIVTPDADARAAIGRNVLDHAARPGSTRAGLAQAPAVADRIRELWS